MPDDDDLRMVVGPPPEEWGPEGFLSPQGQAWLESTLVRSACHDRPVVGNPPRCTGCGHRVPLGSYVPRQTREQPPWTWIPELIARRRARKRGRCE